MSVSLIQFEDQDGNIASGVLQVPNTIEMGQLKSLVNTTQDLYINGRVISSALENFLTQGQIDNVEEVKKIRLSQELPSARPAFYCSSIYSGHEGPVLSTKYVNGILITSGGDKTVRFWDLLTRTQFKIVQKHTHWVVCLDADDNHVVSGGMDGIINVYNHKGEFLRTLSRHKEGISALRICSDKIISCSRDSTCIIWNLDGSILATWNHSSPIKVLCADGDLIGTGSIDGRIKVYKGYKYCCDLVGHTSQVNCIESFGRYIISGDDNGQIIVWKDLKVHKRLQHKREVLSLSFSPNGMSFASGSFDKTVKLWNVETGEVMANYFHVHFVYKVKAYNDLIISCSKDKTVKMFKVSRGKVVSDLVCEDEIYDFDYENGHLVCGSRNNKVYFFN